jgi:RTX calcium-binding nonapeptide repeat (4 copies)
VTVFLTAEDDSVVITRFGDQIAVVTGPGGDGEVLVPCSGGTPTIANTDLVAVQQSPAAGFSLIAIDIRSGALAPGATPEADGTSEIEVSVSMAGDDSFLIVQATDAPETIQAGTTASGAAGLNLNAAGEPTPDPDIELVAGALMFVSGGGGADTISGQGGSGFAGPLQTALLGAFGEGGRDLLVAGPAGALLSGGGNPDRLIGSDRRDYLQGGNGKDVLLAGRARDEVSAVDGRRERIRCGRGKDEGVVDRKDNAKGCEDLRRVKRRRGPPDIGDILPPFGAFFSTGARSFLSRG